MLPKIIQKYRNQMRFRTKLILIIEALVIITTLICGYVVYNNTHALVREILRNKLTAIASATATLADSQKIELIQAQRNPQDLTYLEVHEFLKEAVLSDDTIASIYIMEKTDQENIFKFLVDSTETEDANNNGIIEEDEQAAALGEEFNISAFPEMKDSFDKKIADREIACDKWGCWLSGYAPIFNDSREAIAIIGVDISADQVIAYEKKLKISLLLALGIIITLFPILIFFYLRHALRPISEITDDINKFSGDLSVRIDMDRKDEFGLIANSFNNMASELSDLVKNMEAKVLERTKRIENQKKHIETEKNKTESILKSIGDGVFVVDANFKITMFNKTSEVVTGFLTDEVLGKKYFEVIKFTTETDTAQNNDDLIKKAISTGMSQNMPAHTMLISKPGKEIPIASSVSPLQDKGGKTIGCVVVFRDITHEYEIDKAKTEFVSLASHQLRTPLSAINWYTEMLLEKTDAHTDPHQKDYLKEIYQSNQRMIELINSLLNVSRLEMGTFMIEPRKTDILKLADEVIKELHFRSAGKNIKIKKTYTKTLPEINVDPKLMRIIFQNLLSNALKYTPIGGQIELKIAPDENNLNIQVIDNGLGIPENQQGSIFSKFFRADNVRQTETEGTGLGLYLVKSIVDHIEGQISFDSTQGQGTTFLVSISLAGMKAKKGTKEINEVSERIGRME